MRSIGVMRRLYVRWFGGKTKSGRPSSAFIRVCSAACLYHIWAVCMWAVYMWAAYTIDGLVKNYMWAVYMWGSCLYWGGVKYNSWDSEEDRLDKANQLVGS